MYLHDRLVLVNALICASPLFNYAVFSLGPVAHLIDSISCDIGSYCGTMMTKRSLTRVNLPKWYFPVTEEQGEDRH